MPFIDKFYFVHYQHRDQLSPGYETRIWTTDEGTTFCEGQLGSECFPEMQKWTEKCVVLKDLSAVCVSIQLILLSKAVGHMLCGVHLP